MVELLRPKRGGFLRPFGCGWFIRGFLLGHGPYGSPQIDTGEGAPQAEIFYHYKIALLNAIAVDRSVKEEERLAKRQKRRIDPENIEKLTEKHLASIPYKSSSCRYHSFVVYFSNLQRLGWVEFTGKEEPSALQDNFPQDNHAGIFASLLLVGLPLRLPGQTRSLLSTVVAREIVAPGKGKARFHPPENYLKTSFPNHSCKYRFILILHISLFCYILKAAKHKAP